MVAKAALQEVEESSAVAWVSRCHAEESELERLAAELVVASEAELLAKCC